MSCSRRLQHGGGSACLCVLEGLEGFGTPPTRACSATVRLLTDCESRLDCFEHPAPGAPQRSALLVPLCLLQRQAFATKRTANKIALALLTVLCNHRSKIHAWRQRQA